MNCLALSHVKVLVPTPSSAVEAGHWHTRVVDVNVVLGPVFWEQLHCRNHTVLPA